MGATWPVLGVVITSTSVCVCVCVCMRACVRVFVVGVGVSPVHSCIVMQCIEYNI